jgi:alkylation response protein AidB-like acyl-CoA dehydrogenase
MKRAIFETDHEDFRQAVATFAERSIVPQHDRIIADRAVPRELWLEAGRQELLGLDVPEKYGGSGAEDYRFNAVLGEELARVSAAMPSLFGIHYDIVAPYLVHLTNDEQKLRWLPRFCTGELVTAIGMTEPSAGSDLAALRTTATQDGSDYILDGSKTFITNGGSADLVVVAAKTNPEKRARGITLFAVEAQMPGFHRGRKLDKVGQPEADTSELFFDNLRVPNENIIGEVDRGFSHMMEMLPQERLGAAVNNLGHARPILKETVAYAKERRAFGQAVGSFQHNKFKLAEMATALDVAQTFVDACIMAHTRNELSAVDAAKAKWWTAQTQSNVLDSCVQIFGGYGYMREYRVARAWMDARVTRIWAGSDEIMKEIIGRDLGL